MPVSYETNNRLKALAPVIDEQAEWFLRAVRRVLYPEIHDRNKDVKGPAGFENWIRDAEKDDAFSAQMLEDLRARQQALQARAAKMIGTALSTGSKPDLEEFDAFLALYDGFLLALRRVEQDCALADSGLDVDSGLRSAQAMKQDLEKELERRSRRGKPFCLVIARIDNYDHLVQAVSGERLREIIGIVGEKIKECLRSFDDAYRASSGEFIMSLKQSEMAGGTAAVERLRRLLKEQNILIPNRGTDAPLTMSYCVAEPVPGETFDELLHNMRTDLEKYHKDGNAALEYIEQSPLERFVKDTKE